MLGVKHTFVNNTLRATTKKRITLYALLLNPKIIKGQTAVVMMALLLLLQLLTVGPCIVARTLNLQDLPMK